MRKDNTIKDFHPQATKWLLHGLEATRPICIFGGQNKKGQRRSSALALEPEFWPTSASK